MSQCMLCWYLSPKIRGLDLYLPTLVTPFFQSPRGSNLFSTTAPCFRRTRERRKMQAWLETVGEKFKHPNGVPAYLGSSTQPFPLNPTFQSRPVLCEDSREEIWRQVMEEGASIKFVSARFGVDIRRVAAVVRLKEIEKQWLRQNKSLARPYSRAVMSMLPQFTVGSQGSQPFEPINDLHIHSHTMQQLFLPVSESRYFTREDAAKAFGEHMLPADKRVPHPELIQYEKDLLEGKDPAEAEQDLIKSAEESEQRLARLAQDKMKREEARTTRVKSNRFEFRFQDINVDDAGRDGRSRKGTGWRYGMVFPDRKRGQVKIPTKVE